MKSMIFNKKIYNTKTAKLIDRVNTTGCVFANLYEKKTGELFIAYIEVNQLNSIFTCKLMIDALHLFNADKISERSKKYHGITE
jgi:hypothetical protein